MITQNFCPKNIERKRMEGRREREEKREKVRKERER